MTDAGWASRRWLITGTSSGLGKEMAKAVVARGGTVLAAARSLEAIAPLLEQGQGRITPLKLDVTHGGQIDEAIEAAARDGGIDVLVNNAAYGFVGGVEESDDAEVRAQFETNFFGPARLIRGVLPILRAKRSGYIVNVSSLAAVCAFPTTGWYSASKLALEGLSEALAAEAADFGIRTLIVEPGPFNTEFGRASLKRPKAAISYPANDRMNASRAARDWSQTYDPARGVAAMISAMDSAMPPLRLLLGESAVQTAERVLLKRVEELRVWRATSEMQD